MTQQNSRKEIESEHVIGERNPSKPKEGTATLDTQVTHQSIQENPSFLEKYCASNPGASQCRIYDV